MGTYEDAVASVPRRAAEVPKIYQANKSLYDAFRGGLPVAVFVSTAQWESSGKFNAQGSKSLGEVGYFQISEATEKEYGVPAGTRTTPEGNILLSGIDINCEARRLQLRYPKLFQYGGRDLWLAARGVFALGRGGFYSVLNASPVVPGNVMDQLAAWAASGGIHKALPNGVSPSQPAEKTAYRVMALPLLWKVGEASGLSMWSGIPALPVLPAGMPFRLPSDLAGKISTVSSSPVVWLVAAAAATWWWLKRKKA